MILLKSTVIPFLTKALQVKIYQPETFINNLSSPFSTCRETNVPA